MTMMPSYQRVVIVPEDDYDRLQKELEFHRRVEWLFTARAYSVTRPQALTFLEYLDPVRSEEEGHIAYCLTRTFEEAKKSAEDPRR